MHILFLDDFGHEAAYAYDKSGKLVEGYHPVFGYAGFVMPAENIAGFATEFFDLKTIALRNMIVNKYYSVRKSAASFKSEAESNKFRAKFREISEKIINIDEKEVMHDPLVRRFSAKYEIKGDEVFSRSYFDKVIPRTISGNKVGNGAKSRKFLNMVKWFLKIIKKHNGSIFFYGVEKKHKYSKNPRHPIQTFLMKDLIKRAHHYAVNGNTTISIIMDRHHTDGDKINKEGELIVQGRIPYAKEIIHSNSYYNNMTEPIVTVNSVESQCIQAADWICYLLGQILPYICDKKSWSKYKNFHENVADIIFSNTSELCTLETAKGIIPIGHQYSLPLSLPYHYKKGQRPYLKESP